MCRRGTDRRRSSLASILLAAVFVAIAAPAALAAFPLAKNGRIVFERQVAAKSHVWVMNPDGSNAIDLSPASTFGAADPRVAIAAHASPPAIAAATLTITLSISHIVETSYVPGLNARSGPITRYATVKIPKTSNAIATYPTMTPTIARPMTTSLSCGGGRQTSARARRPVHSSTEPPSVPCFRACRLRS